MKNRRASVGLIILMLVITGMAMIACGPPSPLVGKWQYTEDEKFYEFFSNGKYEYSNGQETYTGRYVEHDHHRLILMPDDGRSPHRNEGLHLDYRLSGNELILWDLGFPIDPWIFIRVE